MNICTREAIIMMPDDEGFLYPSVHQRKCVDCGKCIYVCPFHQLSLDQPTEVAPIVYGVKHKILQERLTSQSGGLFSALSNAVLINGGVVYGVGFDKNLEIIHKRATTKEAAHEFKKSKYVQSDTNTTFTSVKEDLLNGKQVLYCILLPDIWAKAIFGQHDKSYCQPRDLVCHGVPSPQIYKDYRAFVEAKHQKKIEKLVFRDKSFGWHGHRETIYFYDGSKITSVIYKELFYGSIALRPVCTKCPYANTKRPADITMADFWGVEKALPGFDDNQGISLALVNTHRGKIAFDNIRDQLDVRESTFEDSMQHNLRSPTIASKRRNAFGLIIAE